MKDMGQGTVNPKKFNSSVFQWRRAVNLCNVVIVADANMLISKLESELSVRLLRRALCGGGG